VRRTVLVAVAGLVLIVSGGAVGSRPRGFGWTAYAPMSQEVFSPGLIVLDRAGLLSLVMTVAGLVLIAGAIGYALGSRRRSGPTPSSAGDT
jgi:heme/copper-type cytochrome/quinol oxidase subunit 1